MANTPSTYDWGAVLRSPTGYMKILKYQMMQESYLYVQRWLAWQWSVINCDWALCTAVWQWWVYRDEPHQFALEVPTHPLLQKTFIQLPGSGLLITYILLNIYLIDIFLSYSYHYHAIENSCQLMHSARKNNFSPSKSKQFKKHNLWCKTIEKTSFTETLRRWIT